MLKKIVEKPTEMKAVHGNTKSERKLFRKFLHESGDNNNVSIHSNFEGIKF